MAKKRKLECWKCKWMKRLEDSDGRTIHFCVNTNSDSYLQETDVCGWCEQEKEDKHNAKT